MDVCISSCKVVGEHHPTSFQWFLRVFSITNTTGGKLQEAYLCDKVCITQTFNEC
jgi:hypothetical protein